MYTLEVMFSKLVEGGCKMRIKRKTIKRKHERIKKAKNVGKWVRNIAEIKLQIYQ